MTRPPLRSSHRLNAERVTGEVILKDHGILADGHPLRVEVLDAVVLSPGSSITTSALTSILGSGCSIGWESKGGLASFTPARREGTGRFAVQQALVVSGQRSRSRAMRRLMALRFGMPVPISYTDTEVLGWEGSKMAKMFAELSATHAVPWNGRDNQGTTRDFSGVDDINKMLSFTFAQLYREIELMTLVMGMNPSLGLLHKGKRRSFVFDLSELYKAALSEVVFSNYDLGVQGCVSQATSVIGELVRPTFVRYVEEVLWGS